MTKLYRFRSIKFLLGEYNELENQSIYFASPEELNDPLEGFRNIFWQGDQIVWRNFFKNYIYCLLKSIFHHKLCGDSITRYELEQLIPVEERRDKFLKESSQSFFTSFNDLFSDVCNRIFEKYDLNNFIIELGKLNRKARTDEVLLYLQVIHSEIWPDISDSLVEHEFEQDSPTQFANVKFDPMLNDLVKLIQADDDINALERKFEVVNQLLTDFNLRTKVIIRSMSQKATEDIQRYSMVELLRIDYPNSFLKQLVDRLVYPRWYAACFVRECTNSSIWAHYADGHKGVCLIFETNDSVERTEPTITLKQLSSTSHKGEDWRGIPTPIYDINYVVEAGEIDFFRSIGWLSRPTLEECWYSDEEGNFSKCGSHLRNNNVDAWERDYWEAFLRGITAKTKDWKYEKESRMILTDSEFNLSDKRRRKTTYDFNSLKGIVFGISTSNTDKLKIIEIIKTKCQENNRRNFEFFQAYYDHATGRIQNRKLHLKIFE